MTEPTHRAVDGCDSECYLRHHLCAVREVRRLRALVDSFVGAPPERERYELIWSWHIDDQILIRQLQEELEAARGHAAAGEQMVPASWLARANARINELNSIILTAGLKRS